MKNENGYGYKKDSDSPDGINSIAPGLLQFVIDWNVDKSIDTGGTYLVTGIESQAILYLSKQGAILEASTLSLSEISSQEISSIRIESLIDYTFNETGEYILEIYIPENEYKTSKTFTIN